jgi:hypothetical protein
MKYFLDRLKEPSTWRGLALMLGALGVGVSPDMLNSISGAVIAALGLIEVIRRERRPQP